MWIYVLAYRTPTTPVAPEFEKYLNNLSGRKLFDNVWIVRGNLSAHALVESTRAFLGDDSEVFAAEATEDYAVHGIAGEIHRFSPPAPAVR